MITNISPVLLGILRGAAYVGIAAILHYLMAAQNLSGISNGTIVLLITMGAAGADHYLEAKTGSALFGTVVKKLPDPQPAGQI